MGNQQPSILRIIYFQSKVQMGDIYLIKRRYAVHRLNGIRDLIIRFIRYSQAL